MCLLTICHTVCAGGWGTGGIVQTDLGGTESGQAIFVQSDGKVIVAGQYNDNIVALRYNANGTLDNTFGTNGVTVVQYPLGSSIANDVVVLSDGKILLVGTTYNTSTTDVALVKLNSNGSLDSTFAGGGKIRTDYQGANNTGNQLLIGDNGEIYVLEGSGVPSIHNYTPDGVLDTTFDGDGIKNLVGNPASVSSSATISRARGFAFSGPSSGEKFHYSETSSVSPSSGWDEFRQFSISYLADGISSLTLSFPPEFFYPNEVDRLYYISSTLNKRPYFPSFATFFSQGDYNPGRLSIAADYDVGFYVGNTYHQIENIRGANRLNLDDLKGSTMWMPDLTLFVTYGKKIGHYTAAGNKITTFGIGGDINTPVYTVELAPYDDSRVIQLATSSNDIYLAVFNADGSPYINTPPSVTSSTTVSGEVQIPLEYIITATNDPISYSAADLPTGLSLNTSSGTPKVVGTPTQSGTFVATIYATNSGGTGETQVTFEIANTSQTITFNNPGAKVLGALPFAADVSSSSGLPVVVAATSGPVTVIDNTIYLTGLGLATLTASQAGSDDFAPADDVSISFSIVLAAESPTIVTNPTNGISTAGASAVFSVAASGAEPYEYQWLKNGVPIDGETSSLLVLNSVGYFDEAQYSCRVSNSFGDSTSVAASLNVTANPNALDSDGDGISDPLETYLAPFGLDPNVDSTAAWERLQAMVSEQGLGDGYTAEQMRNLALGAPVIQRAENGNFSLRMNLLSSGDLESWDVSTLENGDVAVDQGAIDVTLNPADQSVQFYRISAAGE